MKFCVDCEHCIAKPVSNYTDYWCKLGSTDMVTGVTSEIYAWEMRRHGRCGSDAKLFKRKGDSNRYRADIPELT